MNPWEAMTFNQLNREINNCRNVCSKKEKCCVVDRMDKDICVNLRERLAGIREKEVRLDLQNSPA